jgi:hypothetical protein
MAPTSVLAHAAHGNAFGVPEWLLEAALVLLAVLAWLALRTSWPAPRLAGATGGRLLPAWTAPLVRVLATVAAAVGLAAWALTLTAGLFAVDDPTENLATFVVSIPLLAGGMLLSAVASDWWRAASPFATLARIVPDRPASPAAPAWVGPAMLATYLWLTVAFHLGGEVRWVGAWLAAYTLAAVAGAAAWGRAWVGAGEGFALLLGSVARMAPLARDQATGRLRLRAPLAGLGAGDLPAGTAEACLLTAGSAAFSALRRLDWWQVDVMGARTGWDRTLIDTLGLVFVVGVVVIAWRVATGAQRADPAPLVPLALGVTTAFLLTDLTMRAVDVAALLSDPYGKGWDLLGTAGWFPDVQWQSSTRLAWAEIAALAAGAVLAVVVAHDRALAAEGSRARADHAARPRVTATTAMATAALVLLFR